MIRLTTLNVSNHSNFYENILQQSMFQLQFNHDYPSSLMIYLRLMYVLVNQLWLSYFSDSYRVLRRNGPSHRGKCLEPPSGIETVTIYLWVRSDSDELPGWKSDPINGKKSTEHTALRLLLLLLTTLKIQPFSNLLKSGFHNFVMNYWMFTLIRWFCLLVK